MKTIITSFLMLFLIVACNQTTVTENNSEAAEVEYFGAAVSADGAMSPTEFKAAFNEANADSMFVKVAGDVSAVCKKKGCWMTMDMGNEDELFVKFKDYDFFVPLNCEGRNATIEGWAYKEVMSVEELKHYALDEGKSEEEIAQITEPEVSYTFMADGVMMK